MKSTAWMAVVVVVLQGCASLGLAGNRGGDPDETWVAAHQALAVEDFPRAAALFRRLNESYADRALGRESLFFLGAIHMDPRNPGWDPKPAEALLRGYMAYDSAGVVVNRRPEADILLQLAVQLNMPPRERLPALQPETEVVVRTRPQRVVVPAQESRALAAEVAELRRQLAERDATIQQQQAELERIRRTLTGGTRD